MFRKGTIYMKKYITYTRFLIGILMLLHTGITCLSQTPVTRIYTDHSGYFTSSTSSPVSVDVATQNLIAFRTGSTVWSTGVNNAALTANGITFVPLNFNAMPATVSGAAVALLSGLEDNTEVLVRLRQQTDATRRLLLLSEGMFHLT